jgi:hypothetical protein
MTAWNGDEVVLQSAIPVEGLDITLETLFTGWQDAYGPIPVIGIRLDHGDGTVTTFIRLED